MITNALEFPCIEAARCHLTEKEHGLRLTVTKRKPVGNNNNNKSNDMNNKKKDDLRSFHIELTSKRDRSTEWYVHFGSATNQEGIVMKTVRFRHVGTGIFLGYNTTTNQDEDDEKEEEDDEVKIVPHNVPTERSEWFMEPMGGGAGSRRSSPSSSPSSKKSSSSSSSSPMSSSSSSSPNHNRSLLPSPEKVRRAYSDGFELTRSHSSSIGWENSSQNGSTPPRTPTTTSSSTTTIPESQTAMTAQYHLLPKMMEDHKLSCMRQLNNNKGHPELMTVTDDMGIDPSFWEMEFTSGELLFIRNPAMNCQVRCNAFGKLALSPFFQGWEVFRFIEVGEGNVVISSWTHTHKFLCSDPDGKVYTSENRFGHWEKWRLDKSSPHGLHIVSVAHPDRYLSIGRDDDAPLQTTTKPNDFSLWHLEGAHSNTYYLSTCGFDQQKKLHVSSDKTRPFLSPHRRDWEEWKLERGPGGDISFFSKIHQKYLGCNSYGDLHTTTSKGEWSLWEMEESPHGGIFLKSMAHHHRYMSVHKGRLCTTEESYSEEESFRLEPWLPVTISGPRLAALGVAGAVGLALTMAMPFAVLAVMEVAATEAMIGGSGVLIGTAVIGSAANAVVDEVEGRHLSRATTLKDDFAPGLQRPISAWRDW